MDWRDASGRIATVRPFATLRRYHILVNFQNLDINDIAHPAITSRARRNVYNSKMLSDIFQY